MRVNRYASTSLAVLALATVYMPQARAQNECGVAVDGVATCTDTTLNPYQSGIHYETTTGLHLDVRGGIVVDRSGSPDPHDGILLKGTGDDLLLATIARGVTIKTERSQDEGIQVEVIDAGNSDIRLESGADVEVTFAVNDMPDYTTSAIMARNTNVASDGSIDVIQLSGSTLTVKGDETGGIEVYHEGTGDISVTSSGDIVGEGYWGYGILGWTLNPDSVGALTITQTADSTITYVGERAAGITTIMRAAGPVTVNVDGKITVTGDSADGSLSSSASTTGSATVAHHIGATAAVTVHGEGSPAITTSTEGLGSTVTTVAGTLLTSGNDSHAVLIKATNAANENVHVLSVDGQASISTQGNRSHGVNAILAGNGTLDIDLADESEIDVVGDDSSAIVADASAAGGVAITIGSDVRLAASGANGHGVDARSLSGVDLVVDGNIQVTGENGNALHTLVSAGSATLAVGSSAFLSASGANGRGVVVHGVDAADVALEGAVVASAEYGVGIDAQSSTGETTVAIGSASAVTGGWQADKTSVSGSTTLPAAAIVIGSGSGSQIVNAGTISAGSDRTVYDIGRDLGPAGALAVENGGTITGFVQYANVAGNRFENKVGGTFVVRHFADTDGDGARDTRRAAISDFGGDDSVFANAGTVRVGGATNPAATDAAGYYVPTTGTGSRQLEATFYNLGRAEQAQFVNLSRFEHAGVIDLRGATIGNTLVITSSPTAGGSAGDGLFISNGGELRLNAVLNGGIPAGGQSGSYADMLIVDRTALGSAPTRIMVDHGAASGAQTAGNGIQLVEVRDKSASAAGVFALGNIVASGAYEYHLYHHGVGADSGDGNWYLRSTVVDPDTGEELPAYRPEVPVLTSPQMIAIRFGLDTLGTYHDRHGGDYTDWLPRDASRLGVPEGEHSGRGTSLWGRIYGLDGSVGYERHGMTQQATDFQKHGPALDYDTLGFQVGLDILRKTGDGGDRNVAGIYGSYGKIDADVEAVYGEVAGSLKLDGYSLGLYYTHKSGGGTYIDAVLQGTRYNAKLRTGAGALAGTDGWGFAASLEAGTPFALGEGWSLEPQAQLVYQNVKLDDTGDALTLVDYRDVEAAWGRLGARLGKSWVRSSGLSNMVWARFNVWHDFEQDAEARVSNVAGDNAKALNASLGGTWGQAQLALSSALARNMSGFISGDYNFSLDKMKSEAVGGRIGLRFVW